MWVLCNRKREMKMMKIAREVEMSDESGKVGLQRDGG
tara:strand:- start:752 stop:862 length:111 start_codon:yes stop_codon:yes gene_type:complete